MKTRIRETRIEKGLKQNELAAKSKITSRQLSDIELGKVDFRISTLINIAAALEKPVEYLICKEG